jgi:hypothetical protein
LEVRSVIWEGCLYVGISVFFLCVFDESQLCDRSSAYVTAIDQGSIRADEMGSFNELIDCGAGAGN